MTDSAGFGSCDACGNPLSDREMFRGDVCDRCSEYEADEADEVRCPVAGDIPCVSEDCLRNGCIEEREKQMNVNDDVPSEPDAPAPTVTTSEAKRRKSCADTALFHMRLAREALLGLSTDVTDLDSLIEDAQEASRYYT